MCKRILLARDGTSESRHVLRDGAPIAEANCTDLGLQVIDRLSGAARVSDRIHPVPLASPALEPLVRGLNRLRRDIFAHRYGVLAVAWNRAVDEAPLGVNATPRIETLA